MKTSEFICRIDGQQMRIVCTKIVRCRDCKYALPSTDNPEMLDCTGRLAVEWDYYSDKPAETLVEPNGFCAWGEERTNE